MKRYTRHTFTVPVRDRGRSRLRLPDRDVSLPIYPLNANAIAPETIPPGGLEGPLIYVATGELQRFNRQTVTDAIVLMEIESGKNWQHAANLGAKALIYVDRGNTPAMFLRDKQELSPVRFPRFWVEYAQLEAVLGAFENAPPRPAAPRVRVESESRWVDAETENIYCLVPGSDPRLREELVMVEAFYDSTALVAGRSPGADEAFSVAALLELAARAQGPPAVALGRSGGHRRSCPKPGRHAGAVLEPARAFQGPAADGESAQSARCATAARCIRLLKDVDWDAPPQDPDAYQLVRDGPQRAHQKRGGPDFPAAHGTAAAGRRRIREQTIQALAQQRLLLRKLGWRADLLNLDPSERRTLDDLVPLTIRDHQALMQRRRRPTAQAQKHQGLALDGQVPGAYGGDFAASVQPRRRGRRLQPGLAVPAQARDQPGALYSTVNEVLDQAAAPCGRETLGLRDLYQDTLRPSRVRTWQSYFIDRPPLGGEVSALAGYLGLTLVTVNDARPAGEPPSDLPPARGHGTRPPGRAPWSAA